jgi:hypothetical protein
MQPSTTSARPPYYLRRYRSVTAIPRSRGPGVAGDSLTPARGILNGVALGAVLWAGIIAALIRFLG